MTAVPTISALLTERIAAGDFPSAVYLIGERGREVFVDALGNAVAEPQRIQASVDTIYDLASLTKPLITGMLCARRVESGEITLDSFIARYLPEFDRTGKHEITVQQLLTHSSGLPAWRPLYQLAGTPEQTLRAIAVVDLDYQPGTRVVYSDLGFIVLGLLLEKLSGKTIAELAREEMFDPLRLQHTFFNPELSLQTGIAACEAGNQYERQMCGAADADKKNWREEIIWGQVHDGNAYFLGGAAGHAGLFSTARETFAIASQFLPSHSKLLQPDTCELFRTNLTAGLEEARSFGWQLAETKDSAAGLDLPRDSFGHSGFTGTSCWIDSRQERIYILLTNRTHARALPFANINSVRRRFHSLAMAALDESIAS